CASRLSREHVDPGPWRSPLTRRGRGKETPMTPSAATSEIVRTIEIAAPRELVFRYFTDSERFARWWGRGSSVDPRPGGAVRICYPCGQVAPGQFEELAAPERVGFSFGHARRGQPIP